MTSGGDRPVAFGVIAAVTIVVDLITKLVVEATFDAGRIARVMGDWFRVRLVYNPGAAFGLDVGPYSRWIFLVIALVALVVLYRMARRTPATAVFRMGSLGLVAGGAAGNLIDRIRSPYGVVDFLDIGIGATRWPTFNVADIAVSCGAIALTISLWQEDSHRSRSESAPVS